MYITNIFIFLNFIARIGFSVYVVWGLHIAVTLYFNVEQQKKIS